jgi:RNA-dependent RNA polymerase
MEVFMRSISYTTTEHQLTRELATVLHSREFMRFSSGLPLNFNVALKRKAKGSRGPHTGIGFLTLPTEQVGRYFLSYYAGPAPLRRITTGNRTIMFAPGKSAPRPYILEQIRRMPYRDPLAIEAQEKVTEEYESNAPRISVLQFGWECRDVNPVFSAEYEVVCPGHGFIKFQDEPREIRIRVTDADPTQEVKIVAIALNQIESLSIGNIGAQPAIFFSLSRPPAYETEVSPLIAELRQISLANSAVSLNTPSRQRHSAFDEAHIGTAMYTSHAIRVLCASNADLQTFRSLCITAGLKNWIIDQVPHVERRQLFSQRVRDQFADWIKELDWTVAFQLEAITKRLYLDLTEMLALRYPIEAFTATYGPRKTSGLLRWFSSEVRELFAYDNEGDGESVLGCFERCRKDFLKNPGQPARVARSTDDIFDCYHIQVTPTKYVLQGPFPERQNRVVRKYINHSQCFIRVSFVDENTLLYRFDRDMDGPDFIRKRVGSTLTNFVIGGQKIEFLAYSQSALKEHSVWFVRPFFDDKLGHIINAKRIIDDLGNFHDLAYDRTMGHCPARYAARIAQSFTATDSSVTIEAEEVLFIKDIERKDSNGRKSCFTDGVGTISPELARSIRHALYNKARRRRKPLAKPTAFQIRFMGAKGMLSVDHTLRGSEICIRDSMVKFDAPHANTIEIAQAFDRPSRYYLNRPLIMLLEGLGVSYEIFQEYQDTAVKHAQDATHDLSRTARLLEGHGLGGSFRLPSVLQRLHDLGVHLVPGQFYQIMQEFAVHHVLREMKHKARIPVPGGWIVVGVADVHRYLQPREIFACIRCPDCRRDIYIEGPTLVSRSPTIHPGDVQILHAIGRPPNDSPFARQPLKNTIVFSTEGTAQGVLGIKYSC